MTTSWRKSSRSLNDGNCVEARRAAAAVEMRDSKNNDGPVLRFQAGRWLEFIEGVHLGDFDRP